MSQTIYSEAGAIAQLPGILSRLGAEKLLLVCGRSYDRLNINYYVNLCGIPVVRFSGFAPNPLYEDVCAGLELFRREGCDAILAVGGGSAIDVAKCIKLFSGMDSERIYLDQERQDTGIPLIAVPTTAGTGSESTRHAVIYYQGKKQSISHESIVPDCAVLCPELLADLPPYQKKSTMLDALCQGIESWWSVNSTAESMNFARAAVEKILTNYRAYLAGDAAAAKEIMLGANLAGQAINISATTAPHAMSYKLSSMYHIPHGPAVALCLPLVWEYMLSNAGKCIDLRGKEHLCKIFEELSALFGCAVQDCPRRFRDLLHELDMCVPQPREREKEIEILAAAVNPERLKNNPVALSGEVLRSMYERIIKE